MTSSARWRCRSWAGWPSARCWPFSPSRCFTPCCSPLNRTGRLLRRIDITGIDPHPACYLYVNSKKDFVYVPGHELFIYRDLNEEMVFVSGLTESGMNIDEKDQNENHKKMFELSNQLVRELKESDIIIISAPIYNYGPPATLKAWSDLAARIGETFKFKPNGRREGLLKNKKAYLVITSGGTKLNSNEDFLTPWLKFILNFFGIEKVETISADQMALDYEKSIKEAHAQIDKIKL